MTNNINSDTQAQLVLPTKDLTLDMGFFLDLGFHLDQIYPADEPSVAVLSGHGLCIRIDKTSDAPPAKLHLLTDDPKQLASAAQPRIAPNGTIVNYQAKTYQLKTPPTRHKFEVRQLKNNDSWVIGRAGMLYRDLIPDRLGGSIIASHINIPKGGPVPDMVHYHTIGFQLIFCYRGWVRLVYEDQGPPFILNAGDCVTQPPEIRHQVLEASDNLEVIEIGVPSEHMTTIDHEMELPNAIYNPTREYQGQRFCHHISTESKWKPWILPGWECRDTGVNEATKGMASVNVLRPGTPTNKTNSVQHNADILFRFVMQGSLDLQVEGNPIHHLQEKDAFVIPPGVPCQLGACSKDLEILEVALPGSYQSNFIDERK